MGGRAALRFTRDKHGYEHFYLVTSSEGNQEPRILYWFRTPPAVRIGREPFDDGARRALEIQYPDVVFDWKKLAAAPIPRPDSEWRERRALARVAQAAAREEEEPGEELAPPDDAAALGRPPLVPAPPESPESRERRRKRRRGRRGRKLSTQPSPPDARLNSGQEAAGSEAQGPADTPGESAGEAGSDKPRDV